MMIELATAIAHTAADVVGRRCALRGLPPKDIDFIAYVAGERGFRHPKIAAAIVALAREELQRRNAEASARLRRPARPRKPRADLRPQPEQGTLPFEWAA